MNLWRRYRCCILEYNSDSGLPMSLVFRIDYEKSGIAIYKWMIISLNDSEAPEWYRLSKAGRQKIDAKPQIFSKTLMVFDSLKCSIIISTWSSTDYNNMNSLVTAIGRESEIIPKWQIWEAVHQNKLEKHVTADEAGLRVGMEIWQSNMYVWTGLYDLI